MKGDAGWKKQFMKPSYFFGRWLRYRTPMINRRDDAMVSLCIPKKTLEHLLN